MIPLDELVIRSKLVERGFNTAIDCYFFSSIDSTNRFLKDLPESANLTICCAEKQTHGRGRFQRHWVSPFGENIYFSARFVWHVIPYKLSGLSLTVSLAVLSCLKQHTGIQDLYVKWPNDLMWNNKKLAGILVEVQAASTGGIQVIVGIGINVNSDTLNQPLVDKPSCSLYEMTDIIFNRNFIIADLILDLNTYLYRFIEQGFAEFLTEWQQVDYLRNQSITVNQPMGLLSGYARGINHLGQLLLEDKDGKIHALSSGDSSLNID